MIKPFIRLSIIPIIIPFINTPITLILLDADLGQELG